MKKSSLLFISLFTVLLGFGTMFGQSAPIIKNSFEITQNTMVSLEDFYINSIKKANIESYRLKEKRVSVIFENGFVLELLSAKEFNSINNTIDVNAYQSEFPPRFVLPTFKILTSGELVATYLKLGKG